MIDESTVKILMPELDSINRIFRGGQKVVYRANHLVHGDIVLKLMIQPGLDPRVTREIQILSDYSFPHVPSLYDSGVLKHNGNDIPYLLEQYIDGETLRKKIDRGALPLIDCLTLMHSLLETVVELEKECLVHRDIKPDNIIIDNVAGVWLIDFGIARIISQSSITATAAHYGPHTAGYAAPEQIRNLKKDIDSKADLFAIGVVLYEAISGQNPFIDGARDYLDILRRTETMVLPVLSIPGDSQGQMAGFIDVLMGKFPSRRPGNVNVNE